VSDGLAGVSAAETVLSHVDGERGLLWVRGVPLRELVEHHGYEGAIALIWEGFAGHDLNRAAVLSGLGVAREAAFAGLDLWLDAASRLPLLEAVRMCLASLPEKSPPMNIVSALPVGVAALLRVRRGEAPMRPDPKLSTSADFLRMMQGAPADERIVRTLETYFTTVIDNGLSSSTFTARIIASTRASLVSSVTGAYCAFTGPLHGGAPGPVLNMLDEIAAESDTDAWLERQLAAGKRLMGFGHRVFRVRDPRADILRDALQRLGPDAGRLTFAAEVERKALAVLARLKPGRTLQSNLEMNAALLLEAVGVPRDAFTPVFSIGRLPGWIAHALEQQQTGRMIRPRSTYIGPMPP
jgi:citrate synthase